MANLRAAIPALEARGIRVTSRSSVYETEPQAGAVGQADFLNACIRVETDLDARALLTAAKEIELELGRDPDAPRHAPRPLDIDLLLLDDPAALDAEGLQIPHPSIAERRFVLEPLLELDPPNREALERALAAIEGQRVTRFGSL
jgi:2-amino-4-hydroxy-6-hydroxymethyldihydropteridine diphosphokinase